MGENSQTREALMTESGTTLQDQNHQIVIHFDNLEKLLRSAGSTPDESAAQSQDEEDRPLQAA